MNRRLRSLLLFFIAWLFLSLGAAMAQEEGESDPISLRLDYGPETTVVRDSRLSMDLAVTLLLESKDRNQTHQTSFKMGQRVRSKDRVREALLGRPTRVVRYYLSHIRKLQEPGEPAMRSEKTSLHEKTVLLKKTDTGLRVRPANPTADIRDEELAGLQLIDPFELVLPDDPIHLGTAWSLDGDRFRDLYERNGSLSCRLKEVSEKKLASGETVRFAFISVLFKTEMEAGDLSVKAEMKGTLQFDLTHGRMARLELEGTARGRSVERDETGASLTIETRGPVRLEKTVTAAPEEEDESEKETEKKEKDEEKEKDE